MIDLRQTILNSTYLGWSDGAHFFQSKHVVHMSSLQADHGQMGSEFQIPEPDLQTVRDVIALLCLSDVSVTHCQRPYCLPSPGVPQVISMVVVLDMV